MRQSSLILASMRAVGSSEGVHVWMRQSSLMLASMRAMGLSESELCLDEIELADAGIDARRGIERVRVMFG